MSGIIKLRQKSGPTESFEWAASKPKNTNSLDDHRRSMERNAMMEDSIDPPAHIQAILSRPVHTPE